MAAFDQTNTTGAPVYVPALGRVVQPDETVTFTDSITGFTPIPDPSDNVPAATAALEQDVADAPAAPQAAAQAAKATPATTTATPKAAAATKKEN